MIITRSVVGSNRGLLLNRGGKGKQGPEVDHSQARKGLNSVGSQTKELKK